MEREWEARIKENLRPTDRCLLSAVPGRAPAEAPGHESSASAASGSPEADGRDEHEQAGVDRRASDCGGGVDSRPHLRLQGLAFPGAWSRSKRASELV